MVVVIALLTSGAIGFFDSVPFSILLDDDSVGPCLRVTVGSAASSTESRRFGHLIGRELRMVPSLR